MKLKSEETNSESKKEDFRSVHLHDPLTLIFQTFSILQIFLAVPVHSNKTSVLVPLFVSVFYAFLLPITHNSMHNRDYKDYKKENSRIIPYYRYRLRDIAKSPAIRHANNVRICTRLI